MSLIKDGTMAIAADRYVTPTQTWEDSFLGLSARIPVLDDSSAITLEVAEKAHEFNYPRMGPDPASGGVTAEWRFDDADGTTLYDEIHRMIVTEGGDPTYQVSAAIAGLGKAVTYDGTGDWHTMLTSAIPLGAIPDIGDFSVEVVTKITTGRGDGDTIIACRLGADGVGWQLQVDANDFLDVHIEDADGEVAQLGATDVCTGSYVHILCTFDRDGNLITYLDGASNKTTDISSKEKTIRPADGATSILSFAGDAAATAGDALACDIAFIRLYNRVLTAAEVLDNYRVLMNQGGSGWTPLADILDGDDWVAVKSASDPITVSLTPWQEELRGSAFRLKCATPQTTTPAALPFKWNFS